MMTTNLQSKPCPACGKPADVFAVPVDAYEKYENGATIQEAFPMLTADQRERVMTGLHDQCYDDLINLVNDEFAEDLNGVCYGQDW
jgi:hypothetical protein